MEFILGDILFAGIGWVYLLFRYRNAEKRIAYKDKEFEGMYSNVGRYIFLRFLLLVFLTLLIVGLLVVIYLIVKHGIS